MNNQLLLLHGALGYSSDFDELKSILPTDPGIQSFSFSGHGGVAFKSVFSIDQFVDETKEFIEKHHLAPVNIFGYSMGGYVALKLALLYPELVNKILTLGTKFIWTKASAEQQVVILNPQLIEQKFLRFADLLRIKHGDEEWKELVRKTAGLMLALGNSGALTKDDFSKIKQEVLICLGSEDTMVTHQESLEVSGYLPNGQFQLIEGFKHPIEAIDKIKLAEVIINFFNEEQL